MRNEKAQALIEFVLILPVLIMILFAIIDFGTIMITKSELENKLSDAVDALKNTIEIDELYPNVQKSINDKNIKTELSFNNETNYVTIKLSKEIKTITPGLNLIIGYPYNAKVERVVYYVKQ